MDEIYKGWEICLQCNDWGFFEAVNINDCDAPYVFDKTIEGVKSQIDEIE